MRFPCPMTRAALLVGCLALLPVAPDTASAQSSFRRTQSPAPPAYYAITDARLVPVSGPVVPRGTIVVEDGVITAVGADVVAPEHARVIPGRGLTVYPGLIDALTTLGHVEARSAEGSEYADAPGEYADEPDDRPASTPWLTFAEDLDPGDARLERWRAAGFTTAVSAPSTGFFAGQGSAINLAGDEEGGGRDMVVKAPVALRVNFTGGPGHRGYPGSLMGGIAYLRQTFLDTEHYGEAWRLYEADPKGLARPAWDPVLASLLESVGADRPVLVPASTATELERYLAFARELDVRPVLVGAHGAWEVADQLRVEGVSVLVSLDFPRGNRDGDPEAEPDLATLRMRERAPTAPAELARAGVPFAFYSDGLRDPETAVGHVRLAVKAGLSREAAIEALTLTPARIYGVADRLGTLEPGKIANLTVTEGDLLDDGTRVRMVFVDGRPYENRAEDRHARAGAAEGKGGAGGEGGEGGGEGATEWRGVTPITPTGPYAEADVWVIRGATILTGTGRKIEDGQILVRNGKIEAVGESVDAPAGARVMDAAGKWIIPGIIDPHSHIALESINEGSVSVSSMVDQADVLDPTDMAIYRAAAGGVTTVHTLHGSANAIGGLNVTLKNRWGEDADGLLVEGAHPSLKLALGENPTRERNPPRYPNTRMGVMDVIRQAFLDARAYQGAWTAWERARDRGETRIPPRRDLRLEPLVEVLEGRRGMHVHAYRADETLQMMRLAEELGVRVVSFEHVLEGYKIADEIATHGAVASTFSDWWAYKMEAWDAIPYNAALMHERGALVSLNSDSDEEMRHLNQEAAKTMRFGGLDEHAALSLITLNAAKQLGIEDRVGSLEPGKDADLVIYDGHPFSVFSSVDKTMIEGRIYFDRAMDRERQRLLDEEKRALLEKQRPPDRRIVTDGQGPIVLDLPERGPGGGR